MGGESPSTVGESSISPADRVYMQMVRATADVPVVFLNPNALNRDYFTSHGKTIDPADVSIVRQTIDSQIPGLSGLYTDEQILQLAGLSMDGRHFSLQQDINPENRRDGVPARFAFINLQGNNIQPGDIETAVREDSPLGAIYWSGFWGIHEGQHAGFDHLSHGPLNFGSPGENEVAAVNAELAADREGLEWLRAKRQGDTVQALIDYRALNASADPVHAATAILADEPDSVATVEHFQAARIFSGVMRGVVAEDLGLGNVFEALALERSDPETFNGHVQRLLAAGSYDHAHPNPHVREFIEAYAGAYQRQITDLRLAREAEINAPDGGNKKVNPGDIKGGAPVVILNNGDQATLTIGGVSAPSFFAANADPVLAEQRIALLEANKTDLDTEFTRTTQPALSGVRL